MAEGECQKTLVHAGLERHRVVGDALLLRPLARARVGLEAVEVLRLCPGRAPPFSAVRRRARPYKSAIQKPIYIGKRYGRLTRRAGPYRPRRGRAAARRGCSWPSTPRPEKSTATTALDRSNICKLAHAFLWEYSDKGLELARLLGQLGVFLTRQAVRTVNYTAT